MPRTGATDARLRQPDIPYCEHHLGAGGLTGPCHSLSSHTSLWEACALSLINHGTGPHVPKIGRNAVFVKGMPAAYRALKRLSGVMGSSGLTGR
ncbi:hypothetical protein D9M72_507990 [compost metagenome]